ncbi:hypothetical protein D515_04933 [Grimontia indica]|uniref:Uncharacterized protein n=1 Tax=Grimontia indica TaxID=1056512 RepID=R1GY40_9GAMM|nr:hypothetical protein D515_04933 [Grimontia indica]
MDLFSTQQADTTKPSILLGFKDSVKFKRVLLIYYQYTRAPIA